MTISQDIFLFNVNSSVFELKAEDHRLCSKTARHFMSYTYGHTHCDLDDVEKYILKFFPNYSELQQNKLAKAIVQTLFAAHNVSPFA